MTKKELQTHLLEGLDALGRKLDDLGVTDRVNRHNLAARLMLWRWRWEGEKARLEWRVQKLQRRLEAYRKRKHA